MNDSLSPVLTPERLKEIANTLFALVKADTLQLRIDHRAIKSLRIARGRVCLNSSGDILDVNLFGQYGQRFGFSLSINQLDDATLREAAVYLDRVASQQSGDPVQTNMRMPPRTYAPNTTWSASTMAAFHEDWHEVIPLLVQPLVSAQLCPAAFVGVAIRSTLIADRLGICVSGHECDSEIIATGWPPNGQGTGWAGQVARDWSMLDPEAVAEEAARLTHLAADPVAVEPGRRVAILDRPAVAQLVCRMGQALNAQSIFEGRGPLYDRVAGGPKLKERVLDARITLSTDPNDPDGGYLPFNRVGYPLIPMTFIKEGIFERMAYSHHFAAIQGVTPANDPPASLRISGGTTSIDEMIAQCEEGIYINRLSQMREVDFDSGLVTGTTDGACFMIKDGKITKSIKHLRIAESPWFIFNRVLALGPSMRAPFGYAPWHGSWPIAPTIVPPVMVSDFNFSGLADAV